MLHSIYRSFLALLAAALLVMPGIYARPALAAASAATFIVNSTADLPDTDVGDGICLASNGGCTLRAAIQQANFSAGADTINLPAGVFLLTRAGLDDAAVLGDLDITDSLSILGAGSAVTIVDGNGAVTGDRVFQVLSTAKETTFNGLTIRNGKRTNTFDEGGGLYWDGGGGHLHLKDVVFANNASYYGGGLYLNYSGMGDGVDLDHVTVNSNSATAAAGGLGANFGDLASFTMQSSQIYSNTAYEGGGLYFQGTPAFGLTAANINTTLVYSNIASLSAGIENHSGTMAVPVRIQNSQIYQNHAGFYGGGIGNYGALAIANSGLDSNVADTTGTTGTPRGGAIYNYEGGLVDIQQSTLSRNQSQYGGGIFNELFIHNTAAVTLTNSTLSGNIAARDGGAIYAQGGQVKLFNATIDNNQVVVPMGVSYAGLGGGVYLSAGVGSMVENTLIANNSHQYPPVNAAPDDCLGMINSSGYNLIEATTNCTISGTTVGLITSLDPQLAPLANSFGGTQVQVPRRGSPVIDAGQTPNCMDTNGAPLLVDQRGVQRPLGGRCDIGAIEQFPTAVFLPNVRK